MARRTISINEKIEKQKEAVFAAKDRYETELEKLAQLQKKKRELEGKELLKAFEDSERSLDEVIKFLKKESRNEVLGEVES